MPSPGEQIDNVTAAQMAVGSGGPWATAVLPGSEGGPHTYDGGGPPDLGFAGVIDGGPPPGVPADPVDGGTA